MIGPGEKLLLFEDNYFSDPLEPRHQRGETRHSKEEGKRREGGWRGGGHSQHDRQFIFSLFALRSSLLIPASSFFPTTNQIIHPQRKSSIIKRSADLLQLHQHDNHSINQCHSSHIICFLVSRRLFPLSVSIIE